MKKRAVSVCAAVLTLGMSAAQLLPQTHVRAASVSGQSGGAYEIPDFSFYGAFGTLSADEVQAAAEAFYHCVKTHKTEVLLGNFGIDLTDENAEDLIGVYRTVISCYDAGVLVVNGSISYNTYYDKIIISYRFSGEEYDIQYADCIGKIDRILSGVKSEWSDAEKALYLHDYLAVHYDYDYEALYGKVKRDLRADHSAYGLLANGVAVCEGYANLYAMLLNRLGIRAAEIISDELRHAWNMVCIDGSWYYVDVTWDDIYTQYAGTVLHHNFLRTKEEMIANDHNATDWEISYMSNIYDREVPDTFSNAFWLESEMAIVPWQDGWLTVSSEAPCTLSLHRNIQPDGTSVRTPFLELPEEQYKWPVWDKPGYSYVRNFVAPAVIGSRLFFTTPTAIYALISPEQAEPVQVYALTAEQQDAGYIYGLYAEGNTLYYAVDRSTRSHSETLESPVPYYPLTEEEWGKDLPADELLYDLNGDTELNILDAVALARYVNETSPGGTFLSERADLNQDQFVSMSDLTLLLETLLENAGAGIR